MIDAFKNCTLPFCDMNQLLVTLDSEILYQELQQVVQHRGSGLEKTRLYKNDMVEVLLLTWEPGYSTLPHNHAANGCWLKVLHGSLVETRYDTELVQQQVTDLQKNAISFMNNDYGYHAIRNSSVNVTWSLHVYSPPGHQTTYFHSVL
jgi:hypothetical protein